jgi:hypothetical protein
VARSGKGGTGANAQAVGPRGGGGARRPDVKQVDDQMQCMVSVAESFKERMYFV